jgi:hypothetical protein
MARDEEYLLYPFLWPKYACKARVSWLLFARAAIYSRLNQKYIL